ncbi:MAG TPA: ABC transporter ATP-binding protein [Bryobacteraceae bacterium]|nr:ABC transporter ATP-binding protein [Bryobacteraceae bacterium]
MSALVAEELVVRRGDRAILDRVSLRVEPGGFLSIVGPNGSGKSTLLKALAGIWPTSAGSVTIGSKLLDNMHRREIAQRLAFVPQDIRMDFAFTVQEIVAMGRYPYRGRFDRANSADRDAIDRALERCDVEHLRKRFVTTLSGGERQRVAIARSLAGDPDVVLLDEPTASLDIQHNMEILDLCRALADAGKAVVLATHDLNVVARYTSQVALVDAGKIAYAGSRDDVLTSKVLKSVFRVETELLRSQGGHPVFVFHRRQERT